MKREMKPLCSNCHTALSVRVGEANLESFEQIFALNIHFYYTLVYPDGG